MIKYPIGGSIVLQAGPVIPVRHIWLEGGKVHIKAVGPVDRPLPAGSSRLLIRAYDGTRVNPAVKEGQPQDWSFSEFTWDCDLNKGDILNLHVTLDTEEHGE